MLWALFCCIKFMALIRVKINGIQMPKETECNRKYCASYSNQNNAIKWTDRAFYRGNSFGCKEYIYHLH